MRDKDWKDCPICGSEGTMRYKKGIHERCKPKNYTPFEVKGLDGHFCTVCKDGFWTLASEQKLSKAISEHMAREDAERVKASELASVKEAAQALNVTVQGVHKMMKEGRLRYVFAAGLCLPIRSELKNAIGAKRAKPAAKRRYQST
ncbi:MAG: hypothetical protein K1Y02_10345 [Candidatus Hydrogenedentes bacterium]|nr:hypothetical protein [Candidatus Hydrogenedentota bacterium]